LDLGFLVVLASGFFQCLGPPAGNDASSLALLALELISAAFGRCLGLSTLSLSINPTLALSLDR
jgi:hypothetical protein